LVYTPRKDVAICPKLSSTNPGTDVYDLLPNTSRERTEATICKLEDPAPKHLAKYKQSITSSYLEDHLARKGHDPASCDVVCPPKQ
jgi:hypothetical protein